MANRIRSTALIGGVAVVAVLLLIAQRGQAQTIASDRAAGYVVFPKVVVDSSDIFHQGRAVDTLIQLTNTSASCRVVECFYLDATKHCSSINVNGVTNGACRTNADCIAGTCGLATDWQETNFFMVLSANQAIGWSANSGGVIPADGACPGEPVDPASGRPVPRDCGRGGPCAAPEPFFAGEVKCVEVDGSTPTDSSGIPIAANDLKGEATIYEVAGGIPGGVDVRGYNGVGIQAVSVSGLPIGKTCIGGPSQGTTCASDANCGTGGSCDIAMCLGSNPSVGAVCGAADYASCPSTLILNNFFDGAPDFRANLPITTDLTLVPCSENLTLTGPAATPNTVAQFLVYNEFEQRFSASTSVRCFKETRLTDIDAPGNPSASIFSIFVQGTLTGQTRIRPVTGSELNVGHGLLGVAEEFVGSFPFQGSDAFNLNYVGTNPGKSDVVVLPPNTTVE